MLKMIVDTCLFRRKELHSLEDYELSFTFEKILNLVKAHKIHDTKLCMNETAFFEYIEQIKLWYQEEIFEKYYKLFDILKDSYPLQDLYLRNSVDFIDEYSHALVDRLNKEGVEFVKTIPNVQDGGMSVTDVIDKAINDISPFNKKNNQNLKDAFISETNNSNAKSHLKDTYVFFTENRKDYETVDKKNTNYIIEFVKLSSSQMFYILQKINLIGYPIDQYIIYKEFACSKKVQDDIKKTFENHVNSENYYLDNPHVKKDVNGKYFVDFTLVNNELTVRYFIVDGQVDYECSLIYDISMEHPKVRVRSISYMDNGEIVEIEI